jgi:hypothetical protein
MSSVTKIKQYSFYAYLDIISEYEIEVLGKALSEQLFDNKYQFGGREEYLRDEVPAIYFKDALLGVTVFLEGYKGLYNFSIDTPYDETEDEESSSIDISNNFLVRINALNDPNIKAVLEQGEENDDTEEED